MIVVVEGPTAAGKTTWCRQHAPVLVAEYAATGDEPDGSDLVAQAAYWTQVNSSRWQQALAAEANNPVVVCDTDPLKLHYSWCLWRVGAAPRARFEHDLVVARRAFVAGRLGFADLILVSVPSSELLHERRAGDRTRCRSSFDLHVKLAGPLREWYQTVDALDPGRVLWQLPASGLPEAMLRPRLHRSDPARLDELAALLPGP